MHACLDLIVDFAINAENDTNRATV